MATAAVLLIGQPICERRASYALCISRPTWSTFVGPPFALMCASLSRTCWVNGPGLEKFASAASAHLASHLDRSPGLIKLVAATEEASLRAAGRRMIATDQGCR
jgi:hypothetical protein